MASLINMSEDLDDNITQQTLQAYICCIKNIVLPLYSCARIQITAQNYRGKHMETHRGLFV